MTGQTALHIAVVDVGNEELIKALIEAGANPDAGNYGGFTPRQAAKMLGFSKVFRGVPRQKATIAAVRIQNAEQLADRYYPTFKIPERTEREALEPGQEVKLYAFGRKEQDTVKVRISKRRGRGSKVRYVATVETPLKQTSLPAGTKEVEFGPETVASIYHPAAKKAAKGRRGS